MTPNLVTKLEQIAELCRDLRDTLTLLNKLSASCLVLPDDLARAERAYAVLLQSE
jgi:hypothetical protein